MSFQAVEIVLKQSKQKGAAKLALVCIAYHANKDTGLAWPSLETLAEYCNCTDRYVRDILTKLVEDGELAISYKQGPNGTNLYKILLFEPVIDQEPEFQVDEHNITADPEPEFQVNRHNKIDETEPTRNYSSATPGTIVHNTRNYSSPEPKEPKKNLNNSGDKKSPRKKKARSPTPYQLACGELSQEFIKVTGIKEPTRKSDKDFWFGSCGELYRIAESDVEVGKQLIDYTVKKMNDDNLTISEPNSLVKTARAVMAKRAAQKLTTNQPTTSTKTDTGGVYV